MSAQHELPIAGDVEVQQHLSRVDTLIEAVDGTGDLTAGIATALKADPDLLDEARLLVSVKDKRAYLDLSYLFSRTLDPGDSSTTLCGCLPGELRAHHLGVLKNIIRQDSRPDRAARAAEVVATYLVDTKGLGAMLQIYAVLSEEQRAALITHLVVPGEMQQREAKRRGHGAEAALAQLVADLGCRILPPDKADNPMGAYDPARRRCAWR